MTLQTEHTLGPLLASLARPRRRELVRSLAEQPRSIADLSTILDLGDSAVYENLHALIECKLVRSAREDGRTRYYFVPDGLSPLVEWLRTCGFDASTARTATPDGGATK